MKDDLYILGDSFKQEISSCKSEEDYLRKIKEKYEKLFSILQTNNEKRINKLKEIRLNKIKEIDAEYEKSKLELKELEDEADSILLAYCEKKGHHSDVLIDSRMLGYTGEYSFLSGYTRYSDNMYKCTVCGRKSSSRGTRCNFSTVQKYEQKIPDDIYDDTSLTKNGKTFRMVQEEISKTAQYINYLKSLYSKLCELFGHDILIQRYNRYTTVKCKCCGIDMFFEDYIDSCSKVKVKYRGIVDSRVDYRDKGYIIPADGELVLSLPTFEDYLKTKELEEQEQNQVAAQKENDSSKKLTK